MGESITIKDLVLKEGEGQEAAAKDDGARKSKKSAPEFEVAVRSGIDFAIRRKTAKTSRILAFIVSQEQYYIKDESTGAIELLDPHAGCAFAGGIAKFLRGSDGGVVVDVPWLWSLSNSVLVLRELASRMCRNSFPSAAKSGLIRIDPPAWSIGPSAIDEAAEIYDEHRAVAETMHDVIGIADEAILKCRALIEVEEVYGIDRMRRFASLAAERGVLPSQYSLGDILHIANDADEAAARISHALYRRRSMRAGKAGSESFVSFDFDRFAEYLFVQSADEGFVDEGDIREWMDAWKDDLTMQLYVYGAILDKYPGNLLSHRKRMVAKANAMRIADEAEDWKDISEALSEYDFHPAGDRYFVTHPSTGDDLRREGQALSHCVGGYGQCVLEGKCRIFFLRKTVEPDTPFVTVEVRGDGNIVGQVKGTRNSTPTVEIFRFLRRWCDAVGVKPNDQILAA